MTLDDRLWIVEVWAGKGTGCVQSVAYRDAHLLWKTV